ncbi:uncharacterized protein LOC124629547 [Helicoverpa zea]|uniref:uncharacterized protein LOC124629547 n=1 Tax=Helicoverpa zea TaxID=7113 RepID=UPI001F5620D7|nr:uncharacterized protein LOC124629547 [Helicoverpa zea]
MREQLVSSQGRRRADAPAPLLAEQVVLAPHGGRAMRARAWSWWAALLLGAVRARELDPAACAPRFDVQRDKIIRTEESRDMGARYLSELDVGARAECLRLCCETDACDVFVYEEKGPGSCYLFNCGPPEDFRCKFTAHSNFSSGVLAISRRLAELQDQERLAHHEQELANLRSGAATSTARTTPASTAPPAPAPPPPAAPAPTPAPSARCSRYQFACRRGGECIAVYNACDGVPQCADGSDEAPELGCPPARAPPTTAPPPKLPQAAAGPTAPPVGYGELDAHSAGAEARFRAGDAAGLLQAAPEPAADVPERWPHRLAQAQPQHRYNEGGASSHIFSHKGGLLQEPDSGAQFPAFEPPAPWPRRAWPPPPGGAALEGAAERGWGYWPEPDPRRAWPVPRADQEMPVYIPPKTMPEIPVVYSSQQQTLRDSPKKGFELLKKEASEAPPPERHNSSAANVTRDKSVPASKPAEAEKAVAAAAHVHFPADEHDGLSEHPPAAMMLLVLGLFMLTAMLGMLTCRARAAMRRRRGRGKSPFAHDADYLVNGMYL